MLKPSLAVSTSLALALLFAAPSAQTQTYPAGLVRIIVPFAPGGLNDTAARLIQPYLEKALGQTVIVDNRPAAGGIVGTDAVAKAPPDGHTLLMVASSHTVLPATTARLPYDAEHDLAPIALVGRNPLVFVVNPGIGAGTLAEFIARAKAAPGKLNYAAPGATSHTRLVTELFSLRAGIRMQAIPYRGGAPAIQSVVAGDTEFAVISPLVSLAQIEAGHLKALAVGGTARDPQLPQVPTLAESGFPEMQAIQWVGLLTTAGTPPAVIERLNREINLALQDRELIAKLAQQGITPAGGTAGEFGALIAHEIASWREVAREANIQPE